MRALVAVLLLVLPLIAVAEDAPPFNKDELEQVLRKEHSQKISNVYDSATGTQYTWNIEK